MDNNTSALKENNVDVWVRNGFDDEKGRYWSIATDVTSIELLECWINLCGFTEFKLKHSLVLLKMPDATNYINITAHENFLLKEIPFYRAQQSGDPRPLELLLVRISEMTKWFPHYQHQAPATNNSTQHSNTMATYRNLCYYRKGIQPGCQFEQTEAHSNENQSNVQQSTTACNSHLTQPPTSYPEAPLSGLTAPPPSVPSIGSTQPPRFITDVYWKQRENFINEEQKLRQVNQPKISKSKRQKKENLPSKSSKAKKSKTNRSIFLHGRDKKGKGKFHKDPVINISADILNEPSNVQLRCLVVTPIFSSDYETCDLYYARNQWMIPPGADRNTTLLNYYDVPFDQPRTDTTSSINFDLKFKYAKDPKYKINIDDSKDPLAWLFRLDANHYPWLLNQLRSEMNIDVLHTIQEQEQKSMKVPKGLTWETSLRLFTFVMNHHGVFVENTLCLSGPMWLNKNNKFKPIVPLTLLRHISSELTQQQTHQNF